MSLLQLLLMKELILSVGMANRKRFIAEYISICPIYIETNISIYSIRNISTDYFFVNKHPSIGWFVEFDTYH